MNEKKLVYIVNDHKTTISKMEFINLMKMYRDIRIKEKRERKRLELMKNWNGGI